MVVAFKLERGLWAALSRRRDCYLRGLVWFLSPLLKFVGVCLFRMSGREAELCSVLCAMVKIFSVSRSLGPKLPEGFDYIGVCDSHSAKCWRCLLIELVVVVSEFKCLIKIQLKSRVLKNFSWLKIGLLRLGLREISSGASLSFA